MTRGLPLKHSLVLALLPVQWLLGVVALWVLPQHVASGNTQTPEAAAWVVVAAVVALQIAAVMWRNGHGVAPLLSLILGVFVFSALTLLEAIAHASLL